MRLTVAQIMEITRASGHIEQRVMQREIAGFSWDTRTLKRGQLFVALPGEHVDGNDFVARAAVLGAGACLITRDPDAKMQAIAGEFDCPLLYVPNSQDALTLLAAAWRQKLDAVVIGVTGSTGKTSTKEFLKSVLAQRFRTHATQGNFNNELGVPATVLSAPANTQMLVVEMGMRGLGQIEQLCAFVKPEIGIVTNVGVAHLELLGSREMIAHAKAELLASLPRRGCAVVNAECDMTPELLESAGLVACPQRIVSFGYNATADVFASEVALGDDGCASFNLHLPAKPGVAQQAGESWPVRLQIPGAHNVENALAAAAVAAHLGAPAEAIVRGLEAAHATAGRMKTTTSARGAKILNDTYNANPASMAAALETLASMKCPGRKIAVLGDMGELGENEAQLHFEVGQAAAKSGLDLLICVGPLSESIAQGARRAGMNPMCVVATLNKEMVASMLGQDLTEYDILLVKASRFMGLETIVEALQ